MLPWLLVAAQQAGAGFFSAPDTHTRNSSVFNNGEQVDGQYFIRAAGGLDWVADVGGTSVEDSWWTPEDTVSGSWHCRINYVSGTNQISPTSATALGGWEVIGKRYDFRKLTSGTGGGQTTGVYDVLFSTDGGSTTHHTLALTITLTEPTL